MVLEPGREAAEQPCCTSQGSFLHHGSCALAGDVPWRCGTGTDTTCCGYLGSSGGGNSLFSMCITQSLATNAQCEWMKEEPLGSSTTFCSFAASSVPCRVLRAVPWGDTRGEQGGPRWRRWQRPAGRDRVVWEGQSELPVQAWSLILQQRDRVWQEHV